MLLIENKSLKKEALSVGIVRLHQKSYTVDWNLYVKINISKHYLCVKNNWWYDSNYDDF